MGEWKKVQLREVSSDISYGYTASADDENVGPKFLRITDITSGRINWETVPFCKISERDLPKYQLGVGDIIVARTGATTGYNAIIKNHINAVYASYLIRFQIDKKLADPFFISYVLQSNIFQDYVDAIAGGSAQPGANAQQFADFEFLLPSIPEQKLIASILSSLDDKIDLLHRQNKTLEALAETIFRQWFVEEADESWEEGTLEDEFDFTMGQSPKGSSLNENKEGMIFYQGRTDFRSRFPNPRVYTTTVTRKAKRFDTLVSVRAPVGDMNMAIEECCLGRGVAAFRYKYNNAFYSYTYYKMRSLMDQIKQYEDSGTVFGSIGKEDFKKLENLIPPQKMIEEFQFIAKPLDDKIFSNTNQIRTLTQLRDTLLPKLMSGEVRVKMSESEFTEFKD